MLRYVVGMLALSLVGLLSIALTPPAEFACCYFSAKDKDVNQPAQKAFITWDPKENVETFTVQAKFEGNAVDFGMVVPTPSKPELHEMPRDFFRHLAVFTILEPMDILKYKSKLLLATGGAEPDNVKKTETSGVKILAEGIVGSLEYKVIEATKPAGLYDWLKDNKYQYSGDEATLAFYIKKKWFFTVMKIDSKQMKPRRDGTYEGNVTPTRFTFTSDKLVYPLRITKISVKNQTEALFYVQAPEKMDLPGDLSYQFTFTPMWNTAAGFADKEKLTKVESAWQSHLTPKLVSELTTKQADLMKKKITPATLEWAKRITDDDIGVLVGSKRYNRNAPEADVKALKNLKGHVKKGQFITKFRKVFSKAEMDEDLQIVRAKLDGKEDNIEYYQILPTSPP